MSLDLSVGGQRVRLVACTDPYTTIAPGTVGTVSFWNDSPWGRTLAVRWDDGSTLSLIEGVDAWEWL